MYDFGFSRRFVLVRVWYLSSSKAYTNNWGLFGKENYLIFDWWKHFLKILRRSEVTINLTRRLKKNGSKWVRPLVVLYSIFFYFFFSNAPSPCESICLKIYRIRNSFFLLHNYLFHANLIQNPSCSGYSTENFTLNWFSFFARDLLHKAIFCFDPCCLRMYRLTWTHFCLEGKFTI